MRITGRSFSYDADLTESNIHIFNEFHSYIRQNVISKKMPTKASAAVTNEAIQKEVKRDEYIYKIDHAEQKKD